MAIRVPVGADLSPTRLVLNGLVPILIWRDTHIRSEYPLCAESLKGLELLSSFRELVLSPYPPSWWIAIRFSPILNRFIDSFRFQGTSGAVMWIWKSITAIALLNVAIITSGCGAEKSSSTVAEAITPTDQSAAQVSTDTFREAVNAAMQAAAQVKTAQTTDEWILATQTWNQAVELMKGVPEASPKYAVAQQKIAEYQSYFVYTQQEAVKAKLPEGSFPAQVSRSPGGLGDALPIFEATHAASAKVGTSLVGTHGRFANDQVMVIFWDMDTPRASDIMIQFKPDARASKTQAMAQAERLTPQDATKIREWSPSPHTDVVVYQSPTLKQIFPHYDGRFAITLQHRANQPDVVWSANIKLTSAE